MFGMPPPGSGLASRCDIAAECGRAKFSPDGRLVATASWDNTVRLWNPRTSEPVSPIFRHGVIALTANCSPDGARLLSTGQGSCRANLGLPTNSPARLTFRHQSRVNQVCYSPGYPAPSYRR